jgi:hypothetical protein
MSRSAAVLVIPALVVLAAGCSHTQAPGERLRSAPDVAYAQGLSVAPEGRKQARAAGADPRFGAFLYPVGFGVLDLPFPPRDALEAADYTFLESSRSTPFVLMGGIKLEPFDLVMVEIHGGRVFTSDIDSYQRGGGELHFIREPKVFLLWMASREHGPFRMGLGLFQERSGTRWVAGTCRCQPIGSVPGWDRGFALDLTSRLRALGPVMGELKIQGRYVRSESYEVLGDQVLVRIGGPQLYVGLGSSMGFWRQ